jgi:hypothetical protein
LNLLTPIDQYCERTELGILAEPLNLFTNLSFLIAGFLILKVIKKIKPQEIKPGSKLMAYLIIAIGIGSALFHMFANFLSMWADILPIALFVLVYLWFFLRYEAHVKLLAVIGVFLVFFGLSYACVQLADTTKANGGEAYFGTWIAVFGMACFYWGKRQTREFFSVGSATVIFSLSLFFRTIDMKFCTTWPFGTHLMWHLLNGIVLFMMTKAYVNAPGRS